MEERENLLAESLLERGENDVDISEIQRTSRPASRAQYFDINIPTPNHDTITNDLNTLLSPSSIPEVDFLESLLLSLQSESKAAIAIQLQDRLFSLRKNSHAHKMDKMKFWVIALNRLPAIIMTISLEMGVSLVISSYQTLIARQMLIAAFFPVLSAIAGNIGLQSSTATLRALATGHASTRLDSILKVVKREVMSAAIIGSVAGMILFIVSSLWSSSVSFGFVTGFAILLNSMFSGILGSIGPMTFKIFGVDPALMAGPFETALQDVMGTLIYLILASIML